jgi:hypothetical protein
MPMKTLMALVVMMSGSSAHAGLTEDCAAKLELIAGIKRNISLACVKNCKTDEGLGLFIHHPELDGPTPEQAPMLSASDVESRLETQARAVDQSMRSLRDLKKWYRENCPAAAVQGVGEAVRRVRPAQ